MEIESTTERRVVPSFDLNQQRERLSRALKRAAAYAEQDRLLKPFTEYFEKGLQALTSKKPNQLSHYPDIAPPGFLSLTAEQLLAAVAVSWVFGGMGSWNDYSGSDEISTELFGQFMASLEAATNSSIKSPGF